MNHFAFKFIEHFKVNKLDEIILKPRCLVLLKKKVKTNP